MKKNDHQTAQSDHSSSFYQLYYEKVRKSLYQPCWEASKKDVNKFADCMSRESIKLEKQFKEFDDKMLFTQLTLMKCLQSGGNQTNCTKDAQVTTNLLLKELEKLIPE